MDDGRRRGAEQPLEVDPREQVVLGDVGEAMDLDAGRRARRRQDAAVAAAPARDQRIEAGADLVAAVDERGDVVGDARFVAEQRHQRRRRQAGRSGPPALQRIDDHLRGRQRPFGSDPGDELGRGDAARERKTPRIGRRAEPRTMPRMPLRAPVTSVATRSKARPIRS